MRAGRGQPSLQRGGSSWATRRAGDAQDTMTRDRPPAPLTGRSKEVQRLQKPFSLRLSVALRSAFLWRLKKEPPAPVVSANAVPRGHQRCDRRARGPSSS